ncbi:MAG: TonB family protein [Cellvibrionaceae bacterium]
MSPMHKILSLALLLLLASSNLRANEHWSRLGLSSYEQLSRTLFYAGLTSKRGINADELLQGDVAFQLDVVISSKSLSARRWRNLLMEGVMINHPADQLSSYADDLNQMMSQFTFRLRQGDRFAVQYHPVNGSKIRLNGLDLGRFEQPQFSLLLLRGWVGDVPLSTDFKVSLFSDQSSDIQTQMDSLTVTAERRAETSRALTGNTGAIKAAKNQPAEIKVAPKKPSVSALPVNTSIAVTVVKPEPLAASVEAEKNSQAVNSEPNGSSAPLAQPLPEAEAAVAASSNERSAQSRERVSDTDIDEPANEDIVEVMSEELLRLRQNYYRQLVAAVNAKKAIPFKAFQRGWKGDVRIEVSINRLGEVLEVTILEPSRYPLFNEQAITAAKTAEPLPEIPGEIRDENFTFSVPLSYTFIR